MSIGTLKVQRTEKLTGYLRGNVRGQTRYVVVAARLKNSLEAVYIGTKTGVRHSPIQPEEKK